MREPIEIVITRSKQMHISTMPVGGVIGIFVIRPHQLEYLPRPAFKNCRVFQKVQNNGPSI